jgi:hypothetical protein
MPRYFFHVHDGQDLPDTEGTELPNVAAAQSEAIRASGDMLSNHKGSAGFWAGEDWTMNVTDATGRSLLTLRFSGTLHA